MNALRLAMTLSCLLTVLWSASTTADELPLCEAESANPCYAPLFPDDEALRQRALREDARYYLEFRSKPPAQAKLAEYFNCLDKEPGPGCERVPRLGIALEGGGSKTSPFAMGVLAGLNEAGLLSAVDVVSSVSGGSYAAYHYFSRLLDQQQGAPGSASDWYRDCIAPSLSGWFGADAQGDARVWCPPEGADAKATEPFRHQLHLRRSVDLLSIRPDMRIRTGFDRWLAALTIAELFGEHAITLPWHYLSHIIFDWPINSSPSRERYRLGIERAYGYSPDDWAQASPNDWYNLIDISKRREKRNLAMLGDAYAAARSQCSGTHCGFPLWIIGTTATAGRGRFAWFEIPWRDSLRHQFELSPIGYGSGMFGYVRSKAPDISLLDAVGASAAFLDDEQRAYGDNISLRALIAVGLLAINGDWGTEFRNFRVSHDNRIAHSLTPWPFYTRGDTVSSASPYIHLSDGGNTDNLGLLSHLRRGVQNIVISASTEDQDGQFPSLCRAKNQLELDGMYTLVMPELARFDEVCNLQIGRPEHRTWPGRARELFCQRHGLPDAEGCDSAQSSAGRPKGYDLFQWPKPVLRGCVMRREDGKPIAGKAPVSCSEPGHVVLSRLYVIKPAIDKSQVLSGPTPQVVLEKTRETESLEACGLPGPSAYRGADDAGPQARINWCPTSGGLYFQSGSWQAESISHDHANPLPCQALAYLIDKKCEGKNGFPQENFIFATINTDHLFFSAYFDLGRHYSSHLRWDASNPSLLSVPDSPGTVRLLTE